MNGKEEPSQDIEFRMVESFEEYQRVAGALADVMENKPKKTITVEVPEGCNLVLLLVDRSTGKSKVCEVNGHKDDAGM